MRFWQSDGTFGVWRAYETNPEAAAGETEATSEESSGGGESSELLRRDDWTASLDGINQRFDALGTAIREGFDGWKNQQTSHVDDAAEPDSSSEQEEQEVEIQIQDRQLPPNRQPRMTLHPGAILRRLFLG